VFSLYLFALLNGIRIPFKEIFVLFFLGRNAFQYVSATVKLKKANLGRYFPELYQAVLKKKKIRHLIDPMIMFNKLGQHMTFWHLEEAHEAGINLSKYSKSRISPEQWLPELEYCESMKNRGNEHQNIYLKYMADNLLYLGKNIKSIETYIDSVNCKDDDVTRHALMEAVVYGETFKPSLEVFERLLQISPGSPHCVCVMAEIFCCKYNRLLRSGIEIFLPLEEKNLAKYLLGALESANKTGNTLLRSRIVEVRAKLLHLLGMYTDAISFLEFHLNKFYIDTILNELSALCKISGDGVHAQVYLQQAKQISNISEAVL